MAALSVEADRLLEERRDLIDPGNLRCRYMLDAEIVTVSHHLGILKHADIVEARREGRFMIYRLRDDLLQKAGGTNAKQFLNLGCCRLEIPKEG